MQTISAPERCSLTVYEAFEGTNIRRALKVQPEDTRAAIIDAVMKISAYIDAKKTLTSIPEFIEVAEELMDRFQNFTLEDFRLCLQRMKSGQYYERLKMAEYVAAFQAYDLEKCEVAAKRATDKKFHAPDTPIQDTRKLADLITFEPGERPMYSDEWLRGKKPRLSQRERERLQERDCQRRNAQMQEPEPVWSDGGTLNHHERQQIRKEAASQTKGQAQGQGPDSTPGEDARTDQNRAR